MFGYIRPYKPEMKVREFENFQSCYCALCHTLGKEYGFTARFILNFDFTFMTMLLWDGDEQVTYCHKRCPASPLRRRCVACGSDSLSRSAGYSLILAWWKLVDSVRDDGFHKSLAARMAMVLLWLPYRRASKRWPEFESAVREQLDKLNALEHEGCKSIDQTSDCFARLLSAAGEGAEGDKRRILRELFYHTGRWIYIMDAVNDIEDDLKSGSYNPLIAVYGLTEKLNDEQSRSVSVTAAHSLNIMISAFGLLDRNPWTEINENILYLGMPAVSKAVFDGVFNNNRRDRSYK